MLFFVIDCYVMFLLLVIHY